jgi:cytidyltransferase-like protein
MSVLLTMGTFDAPHVGHVKFLRQCQQLADVLGLTVYVGLNSDTFVKQYRGQPSLYSFDERYELLSGLGFVIVENDGPGADLIRQLEPRILAIGSDWAERDYHAQIAMTQEELDRHGVILTYIPYTPGISTGDIERRVLKRRDARASE